MSGMDRPAHKASRQLGFTIVELLIVIVVIAILAAIVIVAYNGVRRTAIDSAIQADVRTVSTKVAAYRATDGSENYPATLATIGVGVGDSTLMQTVMTYSVDTADYKSFCLAGSRDGRSFFIENDDMVIHPGYCDGFNGVQNDGSAPNNLSGNCNVPLVSGASGSSQYFTCTIPEGVDYVAFYTVGGSSTLNGVALYTRFNQQPTTTTNDCASNIGNNNEQCFMMNPQAGTWHGLLYGNGSFTDTVLYIEYGTWNEFPGGNGGTATLAGHGMERQYFYYDVPAGQNFVQFTVTGGGGETDLAVKYNAPPGTANSDTSNADCTRTTVGDNGACYFNNPAAGRWWVEVSAESSNPFSNVPLTVEHGMWPGAYTSPVLVSGNPYSRKPYTYTVSPGMDYVQFRINGAGSFADISVNPMTPPGSNSSAIANAFCENHTIGENDSCYIMSPTAGTWYAMVSADGAEPFSNVLLTVDQGNFSPYTGSVVISGEYNQRRMYTYTVPSGATSFNVTTSGGTDGYNGANLYLRQGSPPGSATTANTNATCSSTSGNNNETCTISSPAAGTWYILVDSNGTYSGVTLTASHS